MDFSKEQIYQVRLGHRDLGEFGEAKLSFGREKPIVALTGFATISPDLNSCSLDLVQARTEQGHTFTLCQCRVYGPVLYANCIVSGSIDEDKFIGFDVRYSDISEWFLRLRARYGLSL